MKTLTPTDLEPGVLYIDEREPIQFHQKLAELCPIPIEVRTLSTSDYACGDVGIERKTVDDFCASIYSNKKDHKGRLWTQSDRLMKEFSKRYILVTGNLCDKTSNIHIHSLLGGLARMLVEDIQVVFGLQNEDDFCYLLLKILEKDGKFGKVKI